MPETDFSGFFLDTETCFCGSHRAYADCHKVYVYHSLDEISRDLLNFLHHSGRCPIIHDGIACGKRTISSHSIQRERALRMIAVDHHVLTFPDGPNAKAKAKSSDRGFSRVGIRTASTFPGLCAEHDHARFKGVESEPVQLNYRNVLALAERAALHEAVVRSRAALFAGWLHSVPSFSFAFNVKDGEDILRNLLHYAGYSWQLLNAIAAKRAKTSSRSFSFFSVSFSGTLPFTASGCFCIQDDFTGNRIQNLSEAGGKFNYAQFGVLPTPGNQTLFFVSALEDKSPQAARQFVRSLAAQPKAILKDCALRLCLTHCENTYFSPSFIHSLTDDEASRLLRRFKESVSLDVGEELPLQSLSRPVGISLSGCVSMVSTNLGRARR